MGEGGLSPSEVGKEIAEHHHHHDPDEATGRDRVITIVEAILLAVVAVLAAWSGYASSKWSTESSLTLARASAARTRGQPGRSRPPRTCATSTPPPSTPGSPPTSAATRRPRTWPSDRFRPEFKVAFDAWIATSP